MSSKTRKKGRSLAGQGHDDACEDPGRAGKRQRGGDCEGEDGGEGEVSSRTRKKKRSLAGQDDDAYGDMESSGQGDDDEYEDIERTGRTGRTRQRPQSKKSVTGKSSSFKRGGADVWVHREKILTTHQIPPLVGDLIAKISMTSAQVLDESGCTIIQMLTNLITGKEWLQNISAFQVDSLPSILSRCMRAEEVSIGSQFISMVNMLQFMTKLERPVHYSCVCR